MRLVLNNAPVATTPVEVVGFGFVSQLDAKFVGEVAFGYFSPAVFWSNQSTFAIDMVLEIVSAEVGEASLPAGYAVMMKFVSSQAFGIPVILIPEMLNFGVVAVFL